MLMLVTTRNDHQQQLKVFLVGSALPRKIKKRRWKRIWLRRYSRKRSSRIQLMVNRKENTEIRKTKKKYIDKQKSMYSRRNQIIGDIPCFWLIAFMNNRTLQNLLKEDDQ